MILTTCICFCSDLFKPLTTSDQIDDNLVSNGEPGDITLKLREYYMDIVNAKNKKFLSWLSPVDYKSLAEKS